MSEFNPEIIDLRVGVGQPKPNENDGRFESSDDFKEAVYLTSEVMRDIDIFYRGKDLLYDGEVHLYGANVFPKHFDINSPDFDFEKMNILIQSVEMYCKVLSYRAQQLCLEAKYVLSFPEYPELFETEELPLDTYMALQVPSNVALMLAASFDRNLEDSQSTSDDYKFSTWGALAVTVHEKLLHEESHSRGEQ